MRKYLLPFLVFFILIATRIFTIHNAFDSLPSARAFVSTWLSHDWYLSQQVPYRFLFNIPAGFLYELTNFWMTFFSLKIIQFGLFSLVFTKLLTRIGLSPISILVFVFAFSSNQSMVAGEWIYGDPDPKSFAYLFFFFGLYAYLNKKFLNSSFLIGLACSFHVLVGGYLSILYFGMKLIQTHKIKFKEIIIYLLGASIGIYSVIYELSLGHDQSLDLIYVLMRVPHHVVSNWKIQGWVIEYLIYNFIFIYTYLKTKSDSLRSLILFPLLGNVFWIIGLVAFYSGHLEFLKYYFFRVTDTLFPFTAFVLIALYLDKYLNHSKRIASVIGSVFILISSYQVVLKFSHFTLYDDKFNDVYSWIKTNTPKTAIFMVNPAYSNFYVDAERGVLATYKNFPQIKKYFSESIDRLEFATQIELDRSKPLDRNAMRIGYEKRDPELNFSNYQRFNIDYVISEKTISLEHFLLAYKGKNANVYKVLP